MPVESYLPKQMRINVRLRKLSRKDYEMLLLKTCPRCREGDVAVDRDIYGWNALCLPGIPFMGAACQQVGASVARVNMGVKNRS